MARDFLFWNLVLIFQKAIWVFLHSKQLYLIWKVEYLLKQKPAA